MIKNSNWYGVNFLFLLKVVDSTINYTLKFLQFYYFTISNKRSLKLKHTLVMYRIYSILLCCCFSITLISAQTVLSADGPGNTYELITSVLAPNYNPIETPDCGHTSFGRHIEEVWDNELNNYVFAFHIHIDEDDDRCGNQTRQRNEIKTYNQSPDHLLGVEGETHVYKWKFKLDSNFQPATNFCHIHQTKAVGGSESSHPQITLTCRQGSATGTNSADRLELRYAPNNSSSIIHTADLSLFKGVWVEATETIVYGENGFFDLKLVRISDGVTLMDYTDPNIRMWKTDADFIRPKWGIYRSLTNSQLMRDETVWFADFSIHEFDCPPNFIENSFGELTGTESGTVEYETEGGIESVQTILSGADVDYDSRNYVDLKPGFETHLNSFFHAFIDGCN